jgi:hypothetical protein
MQLGKVNRSVAILAVAALNLIFVAPLRHADLRLGKVLSCCRNEMVHQDQDKTRMSTVKISQRWPDSESPECRLDVVQERWGVLGVSLVSCFSRTTCDPDVPIQKSRWRQSR